MGVGDEDAVFVTITVSKSSANKLMNGWIRSRRFREGMRVRKCNGKRLLGSVSAVDLRIGILGQLYRVIQCGR